MASETKQLSALKALSTYIAAHNGTMPRNPNELMSFSISRIDLDTVSYSDARAVIKSYRRNLRRLRQGRVSYNKRTGSFRSRSVPPSPMKKRRSRSKSKRKSRGPHSHSVSVHRASPSPPDCSQSAHKFITSNPHPRSRSVGSESNTPEADLGNACDIDYPDGAAISSVTSIDVDIEEVIMASNDNMSALQHMAKDEEPDDTLKTALNDVDAKEEHGDMGQQRLPSYVLVVDPPDATESECEQLAVDQAKKEEEIVRLLADSEHAKPLRIVHLAVNAPQRQRYAEETKREREPSKHVETKESAPQDLWRTIWSLFGPPSLCKCQLNTI
eukprot:CAMPEP_0197025252 /NCGR_PEP_ID=MMETSP1384-20130603/5650_1 /TAXON_ID=29189 /ORGANISM="Ammonia sp." /LENGTH=327 /DNA_ID=CAMNT_0042453765 /DNA_START=17 /DNA_END=1000 /DNA_ORIENTATION=-